MKLDGELADLVEKNRSPFGGCEDADAALARAGEGPALVPEENALGERVRNGRTVEHDEGPVRVVARVVNGPRGELLARAGLALDEDREVGASEAREGREELAHRDVATAELTERGQVCDLGGERRIELDAQDRAAHLERRARRNHGLLDARAGVEGAVARGEVGDLHAALLLGRADLEVK